MEVFHIVMLVNEMRQRTFEMNFFKQGKSVLLQTGRVRSLRTRAPFVLVRPAHCMSALPPRQVPTEEPPASPVEMPPDAPELPEPTPPGIPGVPPDEAPDTTPSEMPPEVGCGSSTHPGSLAYGPRWSLIAGQRGLMWTHLGCNRPTASARAGQLWKTEQGGTRTGHHGKR